MSVRTINCSLTDEESKKIEYCYFKYTAIKNLLNSFITSEFFDYNEENYNKILSTFIETHTELQKLILSLLEQYGYNKIPLKDFNYIFLQNELIVNY